LSKVRHHDALAAADHVARGGRLFPAAGICREHLHQEAVRVPEDDGLIATGRAVGTPRR
jgi:hypothetical protein